MSQPGILAPCPPAARYLTFGLRRPDDAADVLDRLAALPVDDGVVLGLGEPLVRGVGRAVPGLHGFPALAGPGCSFPSTQGAVWAWVRAADPGEVFARAKALRLGLGEGAVLEEDVAAFTYRGGRDLSGYVDGTENPKGDAAVAAALVAGAGPGLDGSSFVSVQRYHHALDRLGRLPARERDHVVGRTLRTDEELADAPPSAHVKRSAQESYDPPAFMLRRSMPWGDLDDHGLMFVAFGASLDAFERVLRRMAGLEDGVVDALMRFSRASTGGAYWCPPAREGRLDLSALGR